MVASHVSGMGKSLYVERLAETLQKECRVKSQRVIIPIHGPVVNADTVMASLCSHVIEKTPVAQIIHFDIAPSVSNLIIFILYYHMYNRASVLLSLQDHSKTFKEDNLSIAVKLPTQLVDP